MQSEGLVDEYTGEWVNRSVKAVKTKWNKQWLELMFANQHEVSITSYGKTDKLFGQYL